MGVDTWGWDFDNDGIVDNTNQNPSYTFPTSGTFPVYLEVSVGGTCSHDTTINIDVSDIPVAAFTFNNVCFGTTTSFTDLSNPNGGTITNWNWDFQNDGLVDNTSQNTTNGYPAAGSYVVELMVSTTLGCKDSTVMPVVVNPIPVADFSVADVCFGATSIFNDLSSVTTGIINNWTWDFGDLSTSSDTSSMQFPTYSYTSSGTFPVTLTVTSDSGCINTFIDSAHVLTLPTANFVTNNVCLNIAASFTDISTGNGSTISNWQWDFDNNGTTDNTTQNPTNSYPSDGTYDIQLIVSTGFGCSDTIVQSIDIYPMPIADFNFIDACYGTAIDFTDNSSVTSGSINNWDWSFGNSNSSAQQNPSENYAAEGVYDVQLIATTNNSCGDTINKQVEVWPIPSVNFIPTSVCLNAITQFTDQSLVSNLYTSNNIVQWVWDFNGQGSSSDQNPTFVFNTEGINPTTLTVTSNNGCTDSVTLDVIVNPLPQISFGEATEGCADPSVCVDFVNNTTINNPGSIAAWQWDFGDGYGSPSMTPNHCFNNSSYSVLKKYDVTLTAVSDMGCIDSLTMPQLITVYPKPLADFDYNPIDANIFDKEITFIDQSIIASGWIWDFGDGSSFSNESNPIYIYPDSGYYLTTLYIENIYGCTDTTQKTVRINPTFTIWIPNAFTPDGDGINDLFYADGYGIKELQTFIFDRWGLMLFEGNSVRSKWNGTFKGEVCQEDVYVYRIKAKDVFNEWHEFIGKVTLLK